MYAVLYSYPLQFKNTILITTQYTLHINDFSQKYAKAPSFHVSWV